MNKQKIDVGAFIWPSYTGHEPRTTMFWTEGHGEWETVRDAKPKFPGQMWPRKPLLGYKDEAEPETMEEQIDLALSHGVNVFIYDWYWFDDRPFLEQCLDEGFLGARNNGKMKFYLMWANHNANNLWDRRISDLPENIIWQGKVFPESFRRIADRWFTKYFFLDNYYRIDGKPVVAIYDLQNFIDGFGSVPAAREAMEWLNDEAVRRGLPGVHIQLIHQKGTEKNLTGIDTGRGDDKYLGKFPFSSMTHYQFVHFTDVGRDYLTVRDDVLDEWARLTALTDTPYYPHVSIGWDNNPRFKKLRPDILTDNTPENFKILLRDAKKYAEEHNSPIVTVNSWNEWTEGSYLLPDDLNGYGYLDAVKEVFSD